MVAEFHIKELQKGCFFYMKKILTAFLLLFICFNVSLLAFANDTGHPTFQSITIPKISRAKLLVAFSDTEKAEALDRVKRKLFGWSVYVVNENQTVTYVGETIFARANNTKEPLKFNYATTESTSQEITRSATGTVGLKISGKIKTLTAGLDTAVKLEVGVKEKEDRTVKQDFNIVVQPKTKVTVSAKGEARLNNGACKYYIMGIAFKKGMWETIDIINQYYDFYEEQIR
ncbi:MAG: hypothetical protein BWX94_00786 [Tenericutes bacterium ADurb.Bin140]|jgi:hypothetical protein|nr:MAG: hypothetical protein BWX94_00786 [Tenericutes bacterium ADurb.Bin140]